MWELDYKESWVPKNWCFWSVVLEKILESSLDCKEIQPVHPKGDQSWVFIGRTDGEAETPILCRLMWRVDSFPEKTLMLGKIEGRRRRGQQKMRWLNGIIDSMDMGLGGLHELVMDREALHAVVHGVTRSWTQLRERTELSWNLPIDFGGRAVSCPEERLFFPGQRLNLGSLDENPGTLATRPPGTRG